MSNHSGNFSAIARKIIEQTHNQGDSKLTYVFDGHTFNLRIINSYVFLCMAEESFGRTVPFAFLKELSEEFFKMYKGSVPASYATLLPVLQAKMEKFANAEDTSTIHKIQKNLNEVKDTMHKNIGLVMENESSINDLLGKTTELNRNSDRFVTRTHDLKRNLCWANVKLKLLTLLAILLFFYLFAAFFCGFGLNRC